MNTKFLDFNEFYKSNKCLSNTLGGRLINYNHMNLEGLLVSMGASDKEKEQHKMTILLMAKFFF